LEFSAVWHGEIVPKQLSSRCADYQHEADQNRYEQTTHSKKELPANNFALRFWSLLMIPLQKLEEFLDLFFSGIRAVIKRKEFMRLQIHEIVSCGQTSICAPQSFERPGHT
jgi:hypothetical protein